MALPLPRVIPDVGPGGTVVTAMRGVNSLADEMLLRKINQIKAKYAPMTMQAEAASKLAYANLMGPQFLTKLLGNENALGNLTEDQKRQILNKVYGAGTGQASGANALLNIPSTQPTRSPFSGLLSKIFGGGQQPDQMAAQSQQAPQMAQPQAQQLPSVQQPMQQPSPRPRGAVSLEGEQWYDKNGVPVYADEVDVNGQPVEIEVTKGIPPKSFAEKAGEFKGTIKQREEEGRYRAEALKNIGESQLALANAGTVIDRMKEIVSNPKFQEMRSRIPFFQDKQLSVLSKIGTEEEQALIGDFMTTAESLITATAQSMGGSKPLVREYELAQKQKLNPNDTIGVALGKLRAAMSLHDIAYQKNKIVSELLQKGYNEAEAIDQANKLVDVKAIEKQTQERLSKRVTIRNPKTGETKSVTVEEARRLGVPNV